MSADIARLLEESPWLMRLARSVAGDATEAEDVVQDTYAAAMRVPPDTERPVRPWLRRVVINTVRMRHRRNTRRVANESAVEAQLDPVATPEQLLERARLEQRLWELVLALDEPFRTTVLLRFREGLRAEEIAKRLGVPAGTVRSRLKTALDRLRRELGEHDRRRMRAFLVPLAAAPRGTQTLWRLVMAKLTSKIGMAVVLLALLLGAGALVWQRAGDDTRARGAGAEQRPHGRSHATAASDNAPRAFAQPDVASRALTGRVVEGAAPSAGATVRLVHAETRLLLGETTSASDGTFTFGKRPAAEYVVTASAPDRIAAPVRVDLRVPALPPVELRLTGCTHLRGTIVDGSGAPIDHARVGRADAPYPFAESDEHGRYDLCTAFGSAEIEYSADGFQGVLVRFDIGAATTRDVVLIPEATVAGTVIGSDGATVAGAWIVIDPLDKGEVRNAPARGASAADGSFRIPRVSPGRNFISAYAPGQQTPRKLEIVVGVGQVAEGIIVQLERAPRIAGTVTAGGHPVSGAGIGMRVGNRDEHGVLAVTQANGSFVIDRAPRGSIALYVENHTVIAPRSLQITTDIPDLRVEVAELGNVRGRVLLRGLPVADAQVSCPHSIVRTDAKGAYTCRGVDAGVHELFADMPPARWGSAKVTVARGETATLDIELTYSAALCGIVVDERGAALPGLEVRVAELSTGDAGRDTTAADGRFCARLLTGGMYQVAVFAGAREVEYVTPLGPVKVDGPETTADVRIPVVAPRLAISGVVSDSHGLPIADAIIRVTAADSVGVQVFGAYLPSSVTLTDTSGRFELTRLAAGDYSILASARDGSETIVPLVRAGARDVAITLDPAGRIEGRLVGFASEPVITGMIMTGSRVPIDFEVHGERFHATGVSPGTYVLMAVTDAREGDTQEISVRPGQTATVTMTSRGTATITGVARDYRTREPMPGLRCNAVTRHGDAIGSIYSGPDQAVPTDARGVYRLTGPAGEIVVVCRGSLADGIRKAVATRDRTTHVDVFTVERKLNMGTIGARFAFLRSQVAELTKGGSAERAGLALGDEVIAVDNISVTELDGRSALRAITQRAAGERAVLTVRRGDAQRTISVVVEAAR